VSTTVLPPQWANLVPDDNITLGRYSYNGHMKIENKKNAYVAYL